MNRVTRPPLVPLSASQRWRRVVWVAAGVGSVLLIVFWRQLFPISSGRCAFHELTGLPCAFCGGTRALRALMGGQVGAAWHLNPLVFPVVAGGLIVVGRVMAEAALGRALLSLTPLRWRMVLIGLTILLSWSVWHAHQALEDRNTELVNFRHPVVKFLIRGAGSIKDD